LSPIEPCDKDCLRIKLVLKENTRTYLYGINTLIYENNDYGLSILSDILTILAKKDCQYIYCTPYIKLTSTDQAYKFYISNTSLDISISINIDAVSLNNYILPNQTYPYASYDQLSQTLTIDVSKIP
jgi:hypothetical protein